MFELKRPCVLGDVNIMPAVSSVTCFFNASKSTDPLASEGTVMASYPAIAVVAGSVPCEESGIIIYFFLFSRSEF